MSTTEEEIQARKARSLEKFNMYRRREQDIKEGRKYFVEHGLPLLVAFPSDIDFGIYITFEPINESSLRVAFAIRSRKDIDSAKKARGILGHRLKSNDPDTVILLKSDRINKGNFLSKDGGWSFVKLYEAFGFVVLDEVRHWKNCPKWLSRALRNQDTLAFMDHRLLRHFDDDWPFDAVDLAERYYERSWPRLPAPIRVLA